MKLIVNYWCVCVHMRVLVCVSITNTFAKTIKNQKIKKKHPQENCPRIPTRNHILLFFYIPRFVFTVWPVPGTFVTSKFHFMAQHSNGWCFSFPYHSPEIYHSVRHGTLTGNVIISCFANVYFYMTSINITLRSRQ